MDLKQATKFKEITASTSKQMTKYHLLIRIPSKANSIITNK